MIARLLLGLVGLLLSLCLASGLVGCTTTGPRAPTLRCEHLHHHRNR